MTSTDSSPIPKTIATHDGHFHCDELLALAMLLKLPEYKDAKIVRTRQKGQLAKCDLVVDTGHVYDPKKHRYDHHQQQVILYRSYRSTELEKQVDSWL